jgi:hypothetical protein
MPPIERYALSCSVNKHWPGFPGIAVLQIHGFQVESAQADGTHLTKPDNAWLVIVGPMAPDHFVAGINIRVDNNPYLKT